MGRATDSNRWLVPEGERAKDGSSLLLPPSFFYLSTKQAIVGVPLQREYNQIMLGFAYLIEKEKADSGFVLALRKFYPYPVLAFNGNTAIYETTPIVQVEYRFLSLLLSERSDELRVVLAQLDARYTDEQIDDILNQYKRKRIILEGGNKNGPYTGTNEPRGGAGKYGFHDFGSGATQD